MQVFGMTQLRTKPSLPRFACERSNYQATKPAKPNLLDTTT